MRPLYKEHGEAHPSLDSGNTGLWYNKFCCKWRAGNTAKNEGEWTLGDDKINWIRAVTEKKTGESSLLEETIKRRQHLIGPHGLSLSFKTTSHFVTGLGQEHPVENGFAWHHTLGVPYLPGASVKGMTRAWVEYWLSKDDKDEKLKKPCDKDINRIFGPRDGEHAAGSVIFLDALPTAPVQLKADIMTPHYGPYYQDDTGKTPPADWHSPTPIPFLVVDKDETFQFGLLPRDSGEEQHKKDCELVKEWLEQALEWIGAGAKTAVGYGRFDLDEDATREHEEEQKNNREKKQQQEALQQDVAGLSPVARELVTSSHENEWESNKDAFVQHGVIEQWLDRLEAEPHSDAAESLAKLVRLHFPGILENPNKDKIRGKKISPRQRNIAKRLLALLAKEK